MNILKKFKEVFQINKWEVETESGWKDIKASGKTIPYYIWEIKTKNGFKLKCADNHIVMNRGMEIYVKELSIGDTIDTISGPDIISYINKSNKKVCMYDIEVDSDNHTYYTNGILSHNSTWLGNLALKSSKLGHNTAYITFELQEEIVNMRIGANLFSVPLDDYEDWAKDQDRLKKKIQSVRQGSLNDFGVLHTKEFPASTCSVNDLRTYLKKAEEVLGLKFDNIFVDYINIMKNWRNPNTENTYMKIKQIAEDLRAMAMEEKWAVITATQTNRGGWDTNDLSISDVSESAALLHTVDVLFGIITNPEMKARGEYFLKCLANRVAGYENTKKRYTIDWKYSRIEEDKNTPIQDMDFVVQNTIDKQKYHKPRGGVPTGGSSANPQQFIQQNQGGVPVPEVKIEVTGLELFS